MNEIRLHWFAGNFKTTSFPTHPCGIDPANFFSHIATVMDRSKLDTLLKGLPQTEWQLLAAVRELEGNGLRATAHDLLVRAVEAGAGEHSRLELSRRLITRGRFRAALDILAAIDSTSQLHGPASIFRAQAACRLKKFDHARTHLQFATESALATSDVQAWKEHIFDRKPRPPLPYSLQDPREVDDPYDFGASEPTHLFHPDEHENATPDEATQPRTPSLDHLDPPSGVEDEPTYLINIPASGSLDDMIDPDEPTVVRPSVKRSDLSRDPDHFRDITTGVRYKDPTLPGEADLAGEMPRYVTDPDLRPSEPEDLSSLANSSNDQDNGAFVHDPLAIPIHSEENVDEDSDSEPELELDLSDSPRPLQRYSSARQLTAFVKDRAHTHIADVLQSPLRALVIASITAVIVLGGGITLIYSAIFNAHLNQQIHSIERAIEADLYSSHLAALRDLNRLSEYQVLPFDPVDEAIHSLSSRLPVFGVGDQMDLVQDLTLFVEARMSYRFEHPGTFSMEPSSGDESVLVSAARVYHHLSYGEFSDATSLAERRLANPDVHPFATIVYGDSIVAAQAATRAAMIVDNFPNNTPATAFIHAQMRLLIDEDDGKTYLLELTEGINSQHPGTLLELASRQNDYEAARVFIEDLRDSNHPHASRTERARAHIIRAHSYGAEDDPNSQLLELQRAATIAPFHPNNIRPLIDYLLATGELLDARSHLARIPAIDNRHPYFDIALAEIHLSIGDIDRAIERLEPYTFDILHATALQGIARARRDDMDRAQALIDAINEEENAIGTSANAWLFAARGHREDAIQLLEALNLESLPFFFQILAADTFRQLANMAPARTERMENLTRAEEILEEISTERPESRLLACLIALDRRDSSGADPACSRVDTLDRAARPSAFAVLRWHLYNDRREEARALLDGHVDLTGPHGEVELRYAQLDLLDGNYSAVRATLDDLPSPIRSSPDHLLVEGNYALRVGRLQRARRHFDEALATTSLDRPEAVLGRIEADLLDQQPNDQMEESIRALLRHGDLGPRAWSLFASLRLQQNRIADARENIGFADRARDDFGGLDEQLHLLTERIAIIQKHRVPGHRTVEPLLEEAEELDAFSWRLHLLATRWHRHQSELDEERLLHHLDRALSLAPTLCPLWNKIDALDREEISSQLADQHHRPDDCS